VLFCSKVVSPLQHSSYGEIACSFLFVMVIGDIASFKQEVVYY